MKKNLNDRSTIFGKNKKALKFLIEESILEDTIVCVKCKGTMNICKRKKACNGYFYSCKNKKCRNSTTLFKGKIGESPKIKLKDYLYMIYKWIEDNYEKDVCRNASKSKRTFQKIKSIIHDFISLKLKEPQPKLKGVIQVDETAICRGSLLDCPSNIPDDFPGVTWLVGFLETSTEEKNIRLEIVENRSSETMSRLFKKYCEDGSIITTDAHRSYPAAVRNINSKHNVVNHSKGFKSKEGFHTNEIESLWSQLKYPIKKRKGVLKSNIQVYLNEFEFRYKYLRRKNGTDIVLIFKLILKYIFTTNK